MLGCVFDDVRMKPSAQRMLGLLGTYADTKTGMCRPGQRTLATRLGISRQAVSRAIRDLAAAGYLDIIERFSDFNGARLASHYRVRMDFELPDEFRRTAQPEVDGYQPDVDPPQPDVDTPLSEDERGPQPEVAAIEERPRLTTQDERPSGEGVAADAAPASAPPSKSKRRVRSKQPSPEETTAPEAIELTDVSYATALKWGFDREAVDFQLDRFLSKARSLGWTYVDWKAGFRTWLLNEVEYARRDGRPVGGARSAPSTNGTYQRTNGRGAMPANDPQEIPPDMLDRIRRRAARKPGEIRLPAPDADRTEV